MMPNADALEYPRRLPGQSACADAWSIAAAFAGAGLSFMLTFLEKDIYND